MATQVSALADSRTPLFMKSVSILVCLLPIIGTCVSAPSQAGELKSDALARSTQMVVVTASDWNAVEGRLRRYERTTVDEKWRPVGDPISIVVGRNGLAWGIGVVPTDDAPVRTAGDPVKREGDGKSPAGVFALGTAFGYASEPLRGVKMAYLNLTPSIECVDDPGSKHYNRIVDRSVVAPDWNSSEHLRNAGESYRWGVVVDHNGTVTGDTNPPKPGGGSCVFLHIWHSQDQGTAGCTAMSQTDLETLLTWLDPARKPLLVQLPEPAYERLINRWMLPKLTTTPSHKCLTGRPHRGVSFRRGRSLSFIISVKSAAWTNSELGGDPSLRLKSACAQDDDRSCGCLCFQTESTIQFLKPPREKTNRSQTFEC